MASILESDKRHIISLFHSILTAIIAQPLSSRSRVTCSGWTKTPILSWWLPWLASGHEPLWLCSNTEHPSHWMAEKSHRGYNANRSIYSLPCPQDWLYTSILLTLVLISFLVDPSKMLFLIQLMQSSSSESSFWGFSVCLGRNTIKYNTKYNERLYFYPTRICPSSESVGCCCCLVPRLYPTLLQPHGL